MSGPKLPVEAQEEWFRTVEDPHIEATAKWLDRWPNFREHAAFALLGGAIATCDMIGGDVEGFLAELRRTCPKPEPIKPPEGS